MAKRAKIAAIKRRLRHNIECDRDDCATGGAVMFCIGPDPVTAERVAGWFEAEDEWPDVVGAEE